MNDLNTLEQAITQGVPAEQVEPTREKLERFYNAATNEQDYGAALCATDLMIKLLRLDKPIMGDKR